MATKSTTALETPLRDQLDRLASFEPGDGAVVSLYADMRPDQNGQRAHVRVFIRNSVDEQARSMSGDERAAFERTVERIQQHVDEVVPKSSQGVAIFAATKGELFEAIPLDVPV